jgi:transcriptional regulator with XRE-family HTH domain
VRKDDPESDLLLRRFGSVVRRLRLERGFSQEELADRAGFDRTYISTIELGRRNPALVNICRFAEALATTPEELMRLLAEEIRSAP